MHFMQKISENHAHCKKILMDLNFYTRTVAILMLVWYCTDMSVYAADDIESRRTCHEENYGRRTLPCYHAEHVRDARYG